MNDAGSPDDLVALAERLQGLCLGAGLTVATAESCTGGLVASTLTEVAGSSGYVLGGVVAYADVVKREVLGVPGHQLEHHGAVSAQVVRSMAEGARRRFGADLAVAVTGVAGPGGGTDAKPVGLTYVAVSGRQGTEVGRHLWHGDRRANRLASVRVSIEALIEAAGSIASGPGAPTGDSVRPRAASSADQATVTATEEP
jgi:PncC family amidohydrolase